MCYEKKDALLGDVLTRKKAREWLCGNINFSNDNKPQQPFLVRTNFYSFFDCLREDAKKGRNSRILGDTRNLNDDKIESQKLVLKNIEKTKSKIENDALDFLLNSSIWIRFCDNGDWDGTASSSMSEDVKSAKEEFDWFKNLGLYDFDAAKEFIEYQVRAQKENYLDPTINGGHSTHVSPMVYSNEVEFRDFFFGGESTINFKFMENQAKENGFKSSDVSLRILLVDDKMCESCEGKCSGCEGKNGKDKCR